MDNSSEDLISSTKQPCTSCFISNSGLLIQNSSS